jgi:trans-aconitate methyltransferase
MEPKPAHLGPEYAGQWQDAAMAAAYRFRTPYPALVFKVLQGLAKPGPVLEIGAGTGDATLELAWLFPRVDAVEPSAAMLTHARMRTGRNIRWIQATFEDARLSPPYGLVVAAESLQWTDWAVSLPKIAGVLEAGAVLALVDRIAVTPPWGLALGEALLAHSTNREWRPYELVEELRSRRLYRSIGALSTLREARLQPVEDYIESLHSRNGLSRDRMATASEFDAAVREMVRPHLKDGLVPVDSFVRMDWGYPTV